MSELSREKTMTVKEISEVLGVTPEAIKKHVRELFPDFIKNGVETVLSESQVTEIKRKMIPTTKVVAATTEQEENETIIKALSILKHRSDEYKQRAELAEQQLIEQKPKVEFAEAVTGSSDVIDIGIAAKTLNLGIGRNKLFDLLRQKGVLQQTNIPYQKYVDSGYFRTIEQKYTTPDGTTHINIKTVVYQRGLDFIRKIIKENPDK